MLSLLLQSGSAAAMEAAQQPAEVSRATTCAAVF